ncbi:hypothetical protein QOZ94_000432 [Xanthobacter agilis]|uniref:Uncharacterized protein n=1 Tax=Xanthobacter agilis TaxID=47492 RepID=A0ABU0L939_XANAG|nr:hypothetical protein [Xanthobacter agilis]
MPSGARAGRIRAFRSEDVEAQLNRRRAALALVFSKPQEIEQALRAARRAARMGALHYDPARHAALIRLWKDCRGVSGMLERTPDAMHAPVWKAGPAKVSGGREGGCGGQNSAPCATAQSHGPAGYGNPAGPVRVRAQSPSNRAVER